MKQQNNRLNKTIIFSVIKSATKNGKKNHEIFCLGGEVIKTILPENPTWVFTSNKGAKKNLVWELRWKIKIAASAQNNLLKVNKIGLGLASLLYVV